MTMGTPPEAVTTSPLTRSPPKGYLASSPAPIFLNRPLYEPPVERPAFVNVSASSLTYHTVAALLTMSDSIWSVCDVSDDISMTLSTGREASSRALHDGITASGLSAEPRYICTMSPSAPMSAMVNVPAS